MLSDRPRNLTQSSPAQLLTHTDFMDIEQYKNYDIDEDLLEYDKENKAYRYSPAKSLTQDLDSFAPEMFSSLLKLRVKSVR